MNAIQAPGTPEQDWAGWLASQVFPELDLTGLRSVLLVAAHPDDEVLGVGGLTARLAAAGVRLRLAAVTDGEASHPGSTSPVARELATIRRAEARNALAALGAASTQIITLGLPDTGVARHKAALTSRLTELMTGFDLCLAPWSGDIHADHEAAGRAAAAAAARAGLAVAHYPVWAWHWARPGDPRVPWHKATRIGLSAEVAAAKRAAVGCFASQIRAIGEDAADAAILPPAEVAHFLRGYEVIFT